MTRLIPVDVVRLFEWALFGEEDVLQQQKMTKKTTKEGHLKSSLRRSLRFPEAALSTHFQSQVLSQ